MFLWTIREYLSIPFLIAQVLYKNFKGKSKCIEEKFQYGQDKQQHIVFIKPKDGVKKDSIIFFIHGGGWRHGNASLFKFIGYFFSNFGYASIIGGYRLVPKYTYPCQIQDSLASLEAGIKIAKKHKVYHNNLILIGHSGGAQLATILGYSGKIIDRTLGIISISGPLNFNICKKKYTNKLIIDLIKDLKQYSDANPIEYLNNSSKKIPILCIHGENDPFIELDNSKTFIDKLNNLSPDKGEIKIIKHGLHSNLVHYISQVNNYSVDMLNWINGLNK